jgi:hypothetical protein
MDGEWWMVNGCMCLGSCVRVCVCVTDARGQSASLPARLGASCRSGTSGTSFCRHRLRMLDRHASPCCLLLPCCLVAVAVAVAVAAPTHTGLGFHFSPIPSAASLFAPPHGLRLP